MMADLTKGEEGEMEKTQRDERDADLIAYEAALNYPAAWTLDVPIGTAFRQAIQSCREARGERDALELVIEKLHVCTDDADAYFHIQRAYELVIERFERTRIEGAGLNYEQARQIETGPNAGKWHYTNRNNDWVYPIGYCSSMVPCTNCDGVPAIVHTRTTLCATCGGNGVVESPTPCPGHDTAEEAERHYYEYMADHLFEEGLKARSDLVDGRYKCEVCDAPTLRTLRVEGQIAGNVPLCDEHCNRKGWMQARPFSPGMASIHS